MYQALEVHCIIIPGHFFNFVATHLNQSTPSSAACQHPALQLIDVQIHHRGFVHSSIHAAKALAQLRWP